MFSRGWFGFEPSRERFFEKGDLKYVILDLLKEKPRHGYEIIRALEERSRGFYAPSPGAVYPTLQLLDDMGYVTAVEQDGKKVYTITEEGLKFLGEREQTVEDIWSRTSNWWGHDFAKELHGMFDELRDLGRTFKHHHRNRERWTDPEKARRIREVIARARHEIEAILAEQSV